MSASKDPMWIGMVKALRPHQWSKNLLVLAAPLGAGRLLSADGWADVGVAFIAFCLASGATYVLNDLRDLERDREHPTKRHRPMASGSVPPGVGIALCAVALAAAIAVASLRPNLVWTVLAYVVITTTYSLWLKHVAVVELIAVATGFVIRAIAGAVAADVPISPWFFVVVSAGALLMVTGKRNAELEHLGDGAMTTRPVLSDYTGEYLRSVEIVAAGVALVGYALWAFDSAVAASGGAADALFKASLAVFAAALLRYLLLAERGEGAEPEYVLVRDRPMAVLAALWMAVYGAGVLLS